MENQNDNERRDFVKENRAWLIFTGCVMLVGVGLGVYSHRQLKKAVKIVNKAADNVTDLVVVDVQQSIIDHAIDNACYRQVGNAVTKAVRSVEYNIQNEATKHVRNAVQQSYGKIKSVVTDTIAKEVAKIDQSDIMEEATEKAKELLLERFDGKLDGLMSDYQRNLDNVGKIYQSIASSMADKAGKDVTLKLG